MLNRSRRFIFYWLLGLGVATATQAQSHSLKSYRFGDISYVAVRDLAEYYGLGKDSGGAPERADYRTSFASLTVNADGRDIVLNDVTHWLSIPVLAERRQLWISSRDVLKTIDPVFRQGRSPTKIPVRTIMLDPGHGGSDRGTRGDYSREKDMTLDVARRVQRLLEAAGVKVIPTRTTDETVSLQDRVDLTTKRHADLFVSIHFNSGGSAASGIETYCVPPAGASPTANAFHHLFTTEDEGCPGNKYDEQNVWLAQCVQRSLLRSVGATDRGVRRARFFVIRYATCPAILVEAGFLTNHTEEQRILTSEYRDRLAQAIVDGILKYKTSAESPN